jgi:hypothetical protein
MKKIIGIAGIALATVALQAAAQRPIPQGEYACHVVTVEDTDGVVMVQADNVGEAQEAVLGARAFVGPSTFATASTVVECIPRLRNAFRSDIATRLLRSLVR